MNKGITMKKASILFFTSFMLIACESTGNTDNSRKETCLDFPEPPVEIMSNIDGSSSSYDCSLINYFNIIKVREDLFYMYYAAFGANSGAGDINQGLFFAYSSDCIHWNRKKPNGERNVIRETGIQEQSVFVLGSDMEHPYRLIANVKQDGRLKLCMWESTNGYDFDFNEYTILLEEGYHDTQNVIIPRSDALYLYTRAWNEKLTNRRIGLAKYDLEGNLIAPIDTIAGNYLYNSAALYVNEDYDLLIPTYMNNRDGEDKSDLAYPIAYLNSANKCEEIPNNLNQWFKKDEKWMIVAPGIIDINGEKYIAYNTREWSHDNTKPQNGVSRYYLIRVNLYVNGKKLF